jgi:hypothetical protein
LAGWLEKQSRRRHRTLEPNLVANRFVHPFEYPGAFVEHAGVFSCNANRGDRIRTCDFFVPKDDILAEAAGITAGSWYASPATHIGYELIGAGMLTLAGGGRGTPLDYHELERCTRVGG